MCVHDPLELERITAGVLACLPLGRSYKVEDVPDLLPMPWLPMIPVRHETNS